MKYICKIEECTGCMACVDSCVRKAISVTLNHNGFLTPTIDQTLCVDCGACKKTCPNNKEHLFPVNKLKDAEPYEAWALNEEIRMQSSSGGVFGQMAFELLQKGWRVVGVAFDGRRAYHKMIESVEELPALQNTKYVQSDASNSYKKTYTCLQQGVNVFYSGTPCQIAGLYSYLDKKKYIGQLLTMELICHGVPSYHVLNNALKFNNADYVSSFRNKDNGWGYHSQVLEYRDNKGIAQSLNREKDYFYRFFFCKQMLRRSCYECKYASFPRVADITIGDAWGTSNTSRDEVYKGLSTLIINNLTGEGILDKCSVNLHPIKWGRQIAINRNLYTPFPPLTGDFHVTPIDDIPLYFEQLTKEDFKKIPLGLNETKNEDTFLKRIVRRMSAKCISLFEKADVLNLALPIFHTYINLMKINRWTSLLASEKYIRGKYIKLIKSLYKNK